MCHPSFIDLEMQGSSYCQPRLNELAILTDPSLLPLIAERGYRLASYREWQP